MYDLKNTNPANKIGFLNCYFNIVDSSNLDIQLEELAVH